MLVTHSVDKDKTRIKASRKLATRLAAIALLLPVLNAAPASALTAPEVRASSGRSVTVDSKNRVQLYYEESGSGDPVLFVPGWTMTAPFFRRQLDYFQGSKTTRFITYDPRAHGRSTKTMEGANYNQHARDLKALIDRLHLKNVVLGGWSWGMDTVYAYISMYGTDNIRGVVNMDQTPNPLASGDGAWSDGEFTSVKFFFDQFTKDRAGTTQEFMPSFFEKSVSPTELHWMTSEAMMTPNVVAGLLYYDGWFYNSTEIVRNLKIPQIYFVSKQNAPAAKTYLDRNAPDAELISLGEHASFYDQAPIFNDNLARFLAKHP